MKTIFTNGCFDVLHRGHVELLKHCKSLGRVVVGLNSDSSVRKLKGKNRPFFPQDDREYMLRSCRYVDEVIVFNEDTPYNLIKEIKPDLIVKGGDYRPHEVVGNDLADVQIFNYITGFSTTSILENQKKEAPKNPKTSATYVFDIDGTLCSLTDGHYEDATPYQDRINKVNSLYDEGNTIVLFTARGMGRTENRSKEAIRMFFDMTLEQVNSWGVKHHRLILGKPSGDHYIDDKGINHEDFFRN